MHFSIAHSFIGFIAIVLLTSPTTSASDLLPFPSIIVGYQSWSECDQNVYTAVTNGVNVVIWFAAGLSSDSDGNAQMAGGPDFDCVEEKILTLNNMGFDRTKVKHLIRIGGWDSSHPDTTHTADEYYEALLKFNRKMSNGELMFDGLDWDLEGNDSLTSEWNIFTKDCLELMADLR